MKWIQLFKELNEFLLYNVDIDYRTSKAIIKILIKAISDTNKAKLQTKIDSLLSINTIQSSIKIAIQNIDLTKLDNELNNIKNGDKNKPK